MLRHTRLIGTAVLALACSLPASAAVAQVDLRNPDNRNESYQDLRMPDNRQAPEAPTEPAPVIEVREAPSSSFSWGDAGIGAAGIVALLSIVAGSTLLVTNRRRRRGFHATAR